MVAIRLNFVLFLSKEDSLERQKIYIFYLAIRQLVEYFCISEGRKHDAGILADSILLNNLQTFAISPTGQPMCIYGDPAYPLRVHLQAPFRQGRLTPQMQAYNEAMSEVRVSVEWLFGDIINSFKFLDYKKNLKIELSSVGKMYVVCALLRNAVTCLYKNQTSLFF